jgi:hypothetical protein
MRGVDNHRVLLEFVVEDIKGEYARSKGLALEWVHELTTEPWGHRAFYGRDPDRNVLTTAMVVEEPNPSARGRDALTRRLPHDRHHAATTSRLQSYRADVPCANERSFR